MIRLGFRLATAGGRRAVAALVLTAVAVAVGSTLLLLALSVQPAYAARDARSGLFGLSTASPDELADRYTVVDQVSDAFRDRTIRVYGLAGVGDDPPRPAGLALPAPGELLVSDALAELAAREPLLAERYPPSAGRLPTEVVPGPEALLAVRGIVAPPPSDLTDGEPSAVLEFGGGGGREFGPVVTLVIVIGAIAMLAPVVIFVATATRLTAASRERRMAALRLVGATNGQVASLAAVEALVVGVVGAVAGVGLFFLVRPLATYVTIDERWYVTDLDPTPAGFAVALVGVPLAALLGAWLALRRVAISPLGVGPRTRPGALRIWRLVPIAVAVPLFAVVVLGGPGGSMETLTVSFVLVLGALLVAGPWLARALGVVLARTGVLAAVLAGRRLTADPLAGFRAVSGAVVGTFVAAMFLTLVPAVQTELDPAATSGLAADGVVAYPSGEQRIAETLRVLSTVRGVTPTVVRTADLDGGTGSVWIGECGPIARLTGYDPTLCARGRVLVAPGVAAGVRFYDDTTAPFRGEVVEALTPGGYDRPAAIASPEAVGGLPRQVGTLVGFTADPDTIERARTALADAEVTVGLSTAALRTAMASSDQADLHRVLLGAMLGTFVVAGCSAAVAGATGLLERRRSFALLRLTGVPLSVLRGSAVLELTVPLVAGSVVAALLGVLTGRLIGLGGGADEVIPWSTLGGPLVIGVLVATALGCATLPMVRRVTGGDATRFE